MEIITLKTINGLVSFRGLLKRTVKSKEDDKEAGITKFNMYETALGHYVIQAVIKTDNCFDYVCFYFNDASMSDPSIMHPNFSEVA